MKYGVRKPNVKKSIKARTTGKVKRQVKKAVNPLYGKLLIMQCIVERPSGSLM